VKISLDWLSDFVTWDDSAAGLAAKLTSAGLNVESVEEFKQSFPGVVVARVLEQGRHPGADRLSVCKVDDGSGEPVPVVCGAPNVRAGLTVLFARVGAELPGGLVLKKTKIRGEISQGMICSATELELGDDSSGIMELDTDLPPGASADELFGFSDTVLDIEVTPNRPDWLSHLGVAREVAAIYGTKVSLPPAWGSQQSGENLGLTVKVADYADCPRYMAFAARDITVGPSPAWMQRRLMAVGSRPINNLVDITNYVLFELGQPLHAFDKSKLSGTTISIRRAGKPTRVTTLDDADREVDPDTLLICDQRGPVALAGVMGLANTEVSEETTEVLLESAFFNPGLVRTASRGMGLISESSYRFERGADWDMVEKAAQRALHLMQELAGAVIVKDWADRQDPDRKGPEAVPLRIWQVNRMLGTRITTDEAAQLLQRLGLKVQPMGNAQSSNASAVNMMVQVPSFRRDLLQEVDLIEEIARSYGLDNIRSDEGFRGSGGGLRRPLDVALGKIRHWLAASGYHEVVTSSFAGPGETDRLGLPEDDPRRELLAVVNPHHGGDTQLRTALVPSLLRVARHNLNSGARTPLRLFQINRVFRPGQERTDLGPQADDRLLPAEPAFLQICIAGDRTVGMDGIPSDLLALKAALEDLGVLLRLPLALEPGPAEPWLEAGAQWVVKDGEGRRIGSAGHVASQVAESFGVESRVAVAEIDMEYLKMSPEDVRYKPFTRFPVVKRDLSLLVPQGVAYRQVETVVRDSGGELLESVELFDVYRGKGLPEGTGAFGIRLMFRSGKGNLKGKTVDRAISIILEALKRELDIDTRA